MEPLSIIFIICAIFLASGFFSLFDYALAACRVSRLEKENSKKYRALLLTIEKPNFLLTACRLWSNILKVFAALVTGLLAYHSFEITQFNFYTVCVFILCAILLGFVTVLLSDGLPKLISGISPEKTAAVLLPVIKVLSFPLAPFVIPALKLHSFFHSMIKQEASDNSITEDELQDELRKTLIEGEKSGVVESKERAMVEGVFYLGDRPVGAFMTHRSEIQWLDIDAPYDEIQKKALEFRDQHCFPVAKGTADEITGAVYLEDIILDMAQPNPLGLRSIMKKAQFVPETMSALKAFESFKQSEAGFLFVMDEYGGFAGVISIGDLIEEIVGELSTPEKKANPIILQEDGSLLADGALNIDDAVKELSLSGLDDGATTHDFHTLAGFILSLAGELPRAGDSFEYQNYRFTVKKMDGNRIDKLIINKIRDTD
ncbi:MAG: hemolysin family protein [Treponema sp.]|jgi:putative hemolysin|nr:hemolysin family protein [Treponema sp.]